MAYELLVASGKGMESGALSSNSPIADTMPLANLLTLEPGDACRFTDGTDATVEFAFSAAVAVNFAGALAVVNADSDDTVQFIGADSVANLDASPAQYDSGALNLWPKAGLDDWAWIHSPHYISPAQSYQYWRIVFSFSGSYLDVGRLILDAAFVSSRAIDIGYQVDLVDSTVQLRSAAGQLSPATHGAQWRESEATLSALDLETLLTGTQALWRKIGRRRDAYFWVDPGTATWVQEEFGIHGLITEIERPNQFAADFYRARIRAAELLPGNDIGAV